MRSTTHPVKKISDYIQYISYELSEKEWIFRGNEDSRFSLKPSVARIEPQAGTIQSTEAKMLTEFQKRYLKSPTDNWGLLALVQHYGLPTRLLDWTQNPLVAMFFAVDKFSKAKQSVVWAYRYKYVATQELDPFKIEAIHVFHPSHVTNRITVQQGCFTVHPEPFYDMRRIQRTEEELVRFTINNKYRTQIKNDLDRFGINRASLFHELDGLCRYLKWSFYKSETKNED